MGRIVLLDSCTLGVLADPDDADHDRCEAWTEDLRRKGTPVMVPEIADYECRRELIRMNDGVMLAELDRLKNVLGMVHICEEAMLKAAEYWANTRQMLGRKPPVDQRLDADVILCGQAFVLGREQDVRVVVATDNLRHFTPHVDGTYYADAKPWEEIDP